MGDRAVARIMLPLSVYAPREHEFDEFFQTEGFYQDDFGLDGYVCFLHEDANGGGDSTWDNLVTGDLNDGKLVAYHDWGPGIEYPAGKRVHVCGEEAEALTDEANVAYAVVRPDGSIDEKSLEEARLFQRLNAAYDTYCNQSKKET